MNNNSFEKLRTLIDHIEGAYASNTIRAYKADMEEFISYCLKMDACALPAGPEVVAEFLMGTSTQGIKTSTIRRKVSYASGEHMLPLRRG